MSSSAKPLLTQTYNQNLSLNILLVFESNSTALYNWKFKAIQTLTNLINALTQYNILANPLLLNQQKPLQLAFYHTAKQTTLQQILKLAVNFEQLLEQYVIQPQYLKQIPLTNLQKLLPQTNHQNQLLQHQITNPSLQKVQTDKQKGTYLTNTDYQLLILELLQLTTLSITQYHQHHQLLTSESINLLKPIFTSPLDTFSIPTPIVKILISQLQFLLMHVQYETKLSSQYRQHFIDLLSKVSNKKGQLHK